MIIKMDLMCELTNLLKGWVVSSKDCLAGLAKFFYLGV